MRLAVYAGASTALAAGVIIHAFNQRPNFYSACVYLSQSNLCLMILTNLTLFLVAFFVYGLQRLCYGPLRPIEVEQLYEKGWFAITETCLAMTIFRDEVGAWFLVMFVALMAGKSWGWVGEGRVEILEQQPPANARLFHIRLSISLAMSVIYDMWLLAYAIKTVIQQARPNMMVMFLFEFAILATCSYSTALRYGISLIDAKVVKKQTQEMLENRRSEVRAEREEILRQRAAATSSGEPLTPSDADEPLPSEDDIEEMDIEAPGWEMKGQWVLTLDLMTDFVKLGIYSAFFFILLTFYGLPIHIMRDLFITARSFIKRLNAFLKYRNATRDMNQRYPDATVDEIQREDTCIICREEMRPWSVTNPAPGGAPNGAPQPPAIRAPIISERSRPKKLPCGHVLHLGCLKSWLERQQVCPTCRRPVVDTRTPGIQAHRPAHGAQHQIPGQQPLPNGAAAGQPPVANANGVRGGMINIGPLRLAFGRGPMPNMGVPNQQGLHGGHPGAQHQIPPNARVYGFELGFPPAPQVHGPAQGGLPSGPRAADLHTQLQQIEHQIVQEIQSLSIAHAELRVVRNLQAELMRLRQLQGAGNPQSHEHAPSNTGTSHPGPTILPTRTTGWQRHGPAPDTVAIPAGSADLPAGVTIPEGWSLLPLQNLDALRQQGVPNTSVRPPGVAPVVQSPGTVPEAAPATTVPLPASSAMSNPMAQAQHSTSEVTSAVADSSMNEAQTTTHDFGSAPSNNTSAPLNSSENSAPTREPSSPQPATASTDLSTPVSDAHDTDEVPLPNWSSSLLFPGMGAGAGMSNVAGSGPEAGVLFASSQADEAQEYAAAATSGVNGDAEVGRDGVGESEGWKGKGKVASVEEDKEEEGDA